MSENRLYVAPWGQDSWPGTFERPFATVFGAQRAVRSRTGAMESDILVSLRAGTYVLDRPFRLSSSEGDSGRNGHRVVYQAHGYGTADAESVVLSGGRTITGWRPADDGVWCAEVGELVTRQLYVNGRRAHRASINPGIPGNVTKTETGYVTDSVIPQVWQDPASIEFVYRGVYPWTEARCGVAEIFGDERSSTIVMAEPGFTRARERRGARRQRHPDPGPGQRRTPPVRTSWRPRAASALYRNRSHRALVPRHNVPGTFPVSVMACALLGGVCHDDGDTAPVLAEIRGMGGA